MKKSERISFLRNKGRNKGRGGGGFGNMGANLYVKNLAPEVDEEKLKEMFKAYGQITSARVMQDPVTRKSKGFGFVCFSHKENATKAMYELNGQIFNNKPLYVSRAQKKSQRQAHLSRQVEFFLAFLCFAICLLENAEGPLSQTNDERWYLWELEKRQPLPRLCRSARRSSPSDARIRASHRWISARNVSSDGWFPSNQPASADEPSNNGIPTRIKLPHASSRSPDESRSFERPKV